MRRRYGLAQYESIGVHLDQLNGMIILDLVTAERLKRLAPYHSVLDLQKPRTLSGNIALPAPVLATISNWLHEGE